MGVYAIVTLVIPLASGVPEKPPSGLVLSVRPAKSSCVLFEPTLLEITLENEGTEALKLWPIWDLSAGYPTLRVAFTPGTCDGQAITPPAEAEYWGFHPTLVISDYVTSSPRVLSPGEKRMTHAVLLWHARDLTRYAEPGNPRSIERRSGQAHFMESPGTLWVRAHFRHDYSDRRGVVSSAPMAIRYGPVPTNEQRALALWRQNHVASFVQYGSVFVRTQDYEQTQAKTVSRLERLVNDFPKSRYAFYAELALRKPAQWADVAFEGLQLLGPGETPDLFLVDRTERHLARARMLFPDDDRLGVEVTYEFPEYTGFKEVLRVISAQSGVPLRLVPELEWKTLLSARQEVPLREFMKELEGVPGYGQVWVEDGDGYRLITEEEAAKLNKQRGRQGVDTRRRDVPHLPERRSRESTRQVLAGLDQPVPLALLGLLAAAAIIVVSYVRYRAH